MRRFSPLALLPFALASCVAPPREAPAPPPPPPPAPPPPSVPLAADWNDWPFTPGAWRYANGVATFGTGLATLACDARGGRVTLSLGNAGPSAITVRTTSASRVLPAQPAALAANDPLLDAMAFSRGRVVFQQAGVRPLVLRADAEIGRVIEDCRG